MKTNNTQRKPFLLYVLKKSLFKIEDTNHYITSPHTIFILEPKENKEKCLYFKNDRQASTFTHGKIMQGDNYKVIYTLENQVVLDQVLLSPPYKLTDINTAYKRARRLIEK